MSLLGDMHQHRDFPTLGCNRAYTYTYTSNAVERNAVEPHVICKKRLRTETGVHRFWDGRIFWRTTILEGNILRTPTHFERRPFLEDNHEF